MQRTLVVLAVALGLASSASAQVSVGIGIGGRGVNLGINLSAYPDMVLIPGYPVYYDPQDSANYFFYDGLYWVYQDDGWYQSSWYNGPWSAIDPYYVPLFLLRIPVRYYRRPPSYFAAWGANDAPRWDEHWGRDWQTRRQGWDQWDRHTAPRPAPLPAYQRQYAGDRYPRAIEQQSAIRKDQYHFQSGDRATQGYLKRQDSGDRTGVGQAGRTAAGAGAQRQPAQDRQAPRDHVADRPELSRRGPGDMPRVTPAPNRDALPQRQVPDQSASRQDPARRSADRPAQPQDRPNQRPAPSAQPDRPSQSQRAAPPERQQPQQRQQQPERPPQPAREPARSQPQPRAQEDRSSQREGGQQRDGGQGDRQHDK